MACGGDTEEGKLGGLQADLSLLFTGLSPTLALPVMPKKKLKVRRREEPAQVPESPSSGLLLQKESREVRRGSWERNRSQEWQVR